MVFRILNLLLVLGCSANLVFGQISYTYVISSLGSQSNVGNVSLSATMGEPFPARLAAANSVLSVGFEQPQMQINTDTLSVNVICSQQNVTIPYEAWGYINPGNEFTAQLSDANGSFTNPVTIGTKTGTASGSISATLPVISSGSDYKIRVVSSAPQLNGKASPDPLSAGTCDSSQTEVPIIQPNEFKCYPNPACDRIYISTPGNVTGQVIISDLSGNTALEWLITGIENQPLDISGLAQGVYVAYYRNNGTILTTKVVKQ